MWFSMFVREQFDRMKAARRAAAVNRQKRDDFKARQEQFHVRDLRAERARWDARVQELIDAIRAANPEFDLNSAKIIAQERASVERFARNRIQLPTLGLDELVPELENEGFLFFGDRHSVLTMTYFPDGWEIVPVQEDMATVYSSHTHLVDATGTPRAHVFYRDSIARDTLKARIERS